LAHANEKWVPTCMCSARPPS